MDLLAGSAIGGFFVWCMFRFVVKREGMEVDGFAAFSFVIVPGLISLFIGLVSSFLGLPEALRAISIIFFFLVPFLMLRNMYELANAIAAKYAAIVMLLGWLGILPFIVLGAINAT